MEDEEIGEDIIGLKEKHFWWAFREETDGQNTEDIGQNTEDIGQKFKVILV